MRFVVNAFTACALAAIVVVASGAAMSGAPSAAEVQRLHSSEPEGARPLILAQSGTSPKTRVPNKGDVTTGSTSAMLSASGLSTEPEDGLKRPDTTGTVRPPKRDAFDGTWIITRTGGTCRVASESFPIVVAGSVIKGDARTGKISSTGAASWTSPAMVDAAPVQWAGNFRSNTGRGTFVRQDGRCGGTFTARRG